MMKICERQKKSLEASKASRLSSLSSSFGSHCKAVILKIIYYFQKN
jgi:hypothetical protein